LGLVVRHLGHVHPAVVTLCMALGILFSEEFQNCSALAREGWLARLPTLLIALAACALVTALLGTCLGCRESKLLLRTFSVVAALLGCLLLGLALSAWLYSLQAQPLVFQAANLICQEERAWHCKASAAGATEGATEGAAEGAAEETAEVDAATVANWKPNEPSDSSSLSAPSSRRLGLAEKVMAYDKRLEQKETSNGSSGSCQTLQKLCRAPKDFDPITSCVCSGQWRKATGNTTEAPGPWKGSEGAYCHHWGFQAGASEGPWCFVSLQQECSNGTLGSYKADKGEVFGISGQPCTNKVESRSQMMLDAVQAINRTLLAAGLLGYASLIMACCGCVPQLQPKSDGSSESAEEGFHHANNAFGGGYQSAEGLHHANKAFGGGYQSAEGLHHANNASGGGYPVKLQEWPFSPSLDERFEQAQRTAMETLTEETPHAVKMLLYGYYMQAKDGDATGKQPPVSNHWERGKHDAWVKCWGMSREAAKEHYIQAVSMI